MFPPLCLDAATDSNQYTKSEELLITKKYNVKFKIIEVVYENKVFSVRNLCVTFYKIKVCKKEICLSFSISNNILCACMLSQSLQSCLTLCHPTDCSPPGSSVHGILQTRILEWVAMTSSRGSSWPRDRTCISYVSCIGRQVLYH